MLDKILRAALQEHADVVGDNVDRTLSALLARPRRVGCDDQVGDGGIEQNVSVPGGLFGQDVDAGTAE